MTPFIETVVNIFLIALAAIAAVWLLRRLLFQLKPGKAVPARVVSMQIVSERDSRDGRVYTNVARYYVTFAPEGGQPVELNVPEKLYHSLRQGDAGRLTADGRRFVSFRKE